MGAFISDFVVPAIVMIAQSLLVLVTLLVFVAYVLYADRKIWAAVQLRRGPNVVGPWGLLQSFADLLKFVFKEPIIPSGANKGVFLLAPLVTTTLALSAWAVIPVAAVVAERRGRRPVFLAASALLTLWAFPYFWLIDTGSIAAILLACVVTGLGVGVAMGPWGALIAEAFPTAVRYSGSSVAYAVGGVLGGALAPIVATALFANSPFTEGKPNGFLSMRSQIWTDTDADRSGMLPWAFEDGMGFERWVDYALDVPMYFIKRGDTYIDVSGKSFHDFFAGKLKELPGERPTISDWANHLSTIFPEVRLKRYLEMRGADGGLPRGIAPWRGSAAD